MVNYTTPFPSNFTTQQNLIIRKNMFKQYEAKNTKDEKYNTHKINTSRTYTHLLLQYHIKNKNDINFNIDTQLIHVTKFPRHIEKATFILNTTIMGNNGSVFTNKNDIISDLRNHNIKKEYMITNP